MTDVWLVTEGAYDEFRVDSIWSDEDLALKRQTQIREAGGPWADRANCVSIPLDIVLPEMGVSQVGEW